MNFSPSEDSVPTGEGLELVPHPMVAFAAQRQMIAWILGSLALIVVTFFIASWRPLFGGSGFGLAVELLSCVSAITVAFTVVVTNIGYLRGRALGLRNRTVVVIVGVVAGVGALLDLVAIGFASFRL